MNTVDVQSFAQAREQGSGAVIDVRTPAEFREVHVVGSENTPLDSLNPDAIAQSRRPGPLFVLCRSGKRAEQAAQRLIDAGLDDVVCVEGGVQACQSAGLPLSQGRKAMSLERQVRIGAGALVLLGVGLSWLHPAFLGISAFVGAGLVFAGVTDTCGMAMLLARMPWNR